MMVWRRSTGMNHSPTNRGETRRQEEEKGHEEGMLEK
jgi:hypothetical protein